MSEQLFLAMLLVTAAAAYLLHAAYRTWAGRSGCGGGCACAKTAAPAQASSSTTFIPVQQLTLRNGPRQT